MGGLTVIFVSCDSRISNTNADETSIAKSNKFHANTGVLTGVFPPCFQLDPGDVSCINYTVISISTGILRLVEAELILSIILRSFSTVISTAIR